MDKPNFDYFKQIAATDLEFQNQIIEILKNEFPQEKQLFYKSYFENDFQTSAEIVNKINQKIGVLGMHKSKVLATQFEENLKIKKTELFNDFDEILKDITTFIELL